MPYFTQAELSALIPETWLTEGLDDDANGTAEAFEGVRAMAEARVNGILGQRFTTPIDTTGRESLAAFLKDASAHIAASIIFGRRGQADKFPHGAWLDALMKRMDRIVSGEDPLSPTVERAHDSAEAITEPSRVYAGGSLAA